MPRKNLQRSVVLPPDTVESLNKYAAQNHITSTRVSSAALQCNVAVLAENYIDQATPEEILANALRQSCRITRTKPKSDAEYLAEAHEWLNADLDTPSDK